jgi:Tol biopolymer transport system component
MNSVLGHRLAYLRAMSGLIACVFLVSMPLAEATQTPAATNAVFLPLVRSFRLSGKIVFHQFNPSDAVAVVDVARFTLTTLAIGNGAAWSPDGSKIAFFDAFDVPKGSNLYLMNADGSGQTKLSDTRAFGYTPRWSPDGTRILFEATPDLIGFYWAIINADGSGERRLFDNLAGGDPTWAPDGTKIAFVGPDDDIYIMNADGSVVTKLATSNSPIPTPRWSPDGTRIAFVSSPNATSTSTIFITNADGSGQQQLTDGVTDSREPAWSPDGSKIAYVESQRPLEANIIVMNSDGTGRRVLWPHTPETLARPPIWSPDGAYVAFPVWRDSGTLWAVSTNGEVRVNLMYTAGPNIIVNDPQWHE